MVFYVGLAQAVLFMVGSFAVGLGVVEFDHEQTFKSASPQSGTVIEENPDAEMAPEWSELHNAFSEHEVDASQVDQKGNGNDGNHGRSG